MSEEKYVPTVEIFTTTEYWRRIMGDVTEVKCCLCDTTASIDVLFNPDITKHRVLGKGMHEITLAKMADENIFLCAKCRLEAEQVAKERIKFFNAEGTVRTLANLRMEYDQRRQREEEQSWRAEQQRQKQAARRKQIEAMLEPFGLTATEKPALEVLRTATAA